jgi:hypothetical protein
VKLDGGQFTWPADIHIDGKGDLVSRCRDCGLPFITATVGEPLCPTATNPRTARSSARRNPPTITGWRHAGRLDADSVKGTT